MTETALLIEVPAAEEFVRDLRLTHDPVAALGMPPHITVLYQFRSTPLTADDIARLHKVTDRTAPLSFFLTAVMTFPNAVWLHPDSDEPVRRLTNSIWAEFPDCPPYGGEFPDSQPHLTVGPAHEPAALEALTTETIARLEPHLPIRCAADNLSLYSLESERWELTNRFHLRGD